MVYGMARRAYFIRQPSHKIYMEYWIFYRVVTSSAGQLFFLQLEFASVGADNNNNNDDDDDKNGSVLKADQTAQSAKQVNIFYKPSL